MVRRRVRLDVSKPYSVTVIINIHFNFNHLGLAVEPKKVEKVICVKVCDSNLSLHTRLI